MIAAALLVLQAGTLTGEFQSPRVVESSGVAVSRAHPGILWTHNDSGDGPYLYATDVQGRDLGALLVPGAGAIDWEDMALGPCPTHAGGGTCVYLADTGDNLEARPFVSVYAVAEPEPPTGPADTSRTTAAPATLKVVYPDGPHDVEAVYVSPRDTALYLVTKGRSGAIRLYRVDRARWAAGQTGFVVATLVQALPITPNREAGRWVTGASISTDGGLVAVRTYTEIYLFTPRAGGQLVPARDAGRPCDIAGLEAGGGEAIDFLTDSTLVLTTEAMGRRAGTIHTVTCKRS